MKWKESKLYYKSKIDWWMRKEKRKFYFSFCFVNESINCGCPFNSFFSLSSLFLMGELVKKKRVDGLGRPERIENEAKQAKSLWIGWVSGGTAARQPANEEDEPPAAADWTMKRREQPSQPSTQSPAFLWLSMPSQEKRDWIVDGLSELWNEFVLLILILGGLRAAAAALLRTKEKAIKQNKRNEQWMKPK